MNKELVFRLGIVVVFLGGICSCASEKCALGNPELRKEVETLTGLGFPDSVEWMHCKLDRGMDYFFAAKFNIRRKDIPLLFSGHDVDWTNERRCLKNAHCKQEWFDPDSVETYKALDTMWPNGNSCLRALYDDSPLGDDAVVVFYLVWFEVS